MVERGPGESGQDLGFGLWLLQECLRTQEVSVLSKRLTSTNKNITEVCQKVLCDIHAAKII